MNSVQYLTKCNFPGCVRHPLGNGMCVGHQGYANFKIVKVPKRINKESDTRKDEKKEYDRIVKEMFAAGKDCQLRVAGVCTNLAEGLHHMKKRGANYLNKKYLKRACNACNRWAEKHPKEALETGVSESKFKPEV